jgi:transcriptional regulator with XRE-family HTH domain
MPQSRLGLRLREVREMKKLSLKAVAEPAGISATYLQKLERDEVKAPSPHILFALSEVLKIPYSNLMELAGYVIPASGERTEGSLLAYALSSEELTDDEAEALARYLSWYRHEKGLQPH